MAEHDDVPLSVRLECYERDNNCCRVCGQHVDPRGLHHVIYRSQGGLHVPENLVTIGWTPGHDCHNPVVHAYPNLWRPILQQVLVTPGVNARQLLRWYREAEKRRKVIPLAVPGV